MNTSVAVPVAVPVTAVWTATVFVLARWGAARRPRRPAANVADATATATATETTATAIDTAVVVAAASATAGGGATIGSIGRATASATARRRSLGRVALVTVAALLVAGPAGALLVTVVAVARARLGAIARRRRAADELWSSAPDVVALLQLAITSGLTPYLAVIEVSALVPRPFAPGFRRLADDLLAGRRLGDGLQRLLAEQGEPARPLVAALTAGDRYGVPVIPALEAAAVELRRRRRQAADARARRLPVLLSFPLVSCILPAFVCLSIAPVAVSALRSLQAPASAVVPRPSPGSPTSTTSPGGSP